MVGSRLVAQLMMADTLRRRQRLEEEEQRGSGTGGVSDIDSDRAVVNEEHMRRRIGQDKVQCIRKHPQGMHVPSALLNSLLQPSEAIDAALAGLSSKWRNYVIRLLLQFYSKSAIQFCMGDH